MNVSGLHLYSMGIVAENKVMSSNEILVVPHEVLPMVDGDIKSNPQQQSISGVDASGRSYSVNVVHDNVIKATWYNKAGDNRSTSPDVRRGEKVEIWRYQDTDQFYWHSTAMDNNLRKLETVRHTYSATTDEAQTEQKPENTYYTEVSTHAQTATLSTSKANGEVAAYTVQIDAKNGVVHVQDDAGQKFELDTKNKRMSMTNADGSQIRIDQKNISFVCTDTLGINATNRIVMQSKAIVIGCETLSVVASTSVKFDTPSCEFTNAVKMKTLEVTETSTQTGAAHFGASVHVDGNVDADGHVHGS